MSNDGGWPRAALVVALSLVGFPVVWPLYVVRSAIRGRWHRARMARAVKPKNAEAMLARVLAGKAKRALISTRGTPTMASGLEEEVCIELTFDDGDVVVSGSEELSEALEKMKVPTREEESQEQGLGTLFAWGLWLVSVLALASLITSSWFLGVAATVLLAALIALALS